MTNPVSALPDRARFATGVIRRTLIALLLVGSLAGCGSSPSTANQTTVVAGSATGSAEVPELLQFTARLVGGGEFSGAGYAGRATAFWFWAPT